MDPRAGLDDLEKTKFLTLPGLELRPLGRPARSQSLYRLRYPGSRVNYVHMNLYRTLLDICFACYSLAIREFRDDEIIAPDIVYYCCQHISY
jgi:hypothetical protein